MHRSDGAAFRTLAVGSQAAISLEHALNWIFGPIIALTIYSPLALWSQHSYAHIDEPPGTVMRLMAFTKLSNYPGRFGYSSYGSRIRALTKAQGAPKLDTLVIYEDDKPLGHAGAIPLEIEDIGLGRFTNFRGVVFYISTSDNSDPRTNGRKYWVVLPD